MKRFSVCLQASARDTRLPIACEGGGALRVRQPAQSRRLLLHQVTRSLLPSAIFGSAPTTISRYQSLMRCRDACQYEMPLQSDNLSCNALRLLAGMQCVS